MTSFVPDPGQPTPANTPTVGPPGSAIAGMLSQAGIAQAQAGVQKLTEAAKSGGFSINEEGANAYIKAFQDFEDQLDNLQRVTERAGQKPELGGSDYAQRVASFTQGMATGMDQSFQQALQQLGVIVRQAREAFEEAKKHYNEMEDQAVQTFHGVQD